MFRGAALSLSLLLLPLLLAGQRVSSVSTRWSDSFVEWEIFAPVPDTMRDDDLEEAPDEERIGEFKLRWLNVRDDWSEWDYEIGDQRGTIRMKWKDDPTQWELRAYDGAIVSMRAAWANDPTQWRITDNDVALSLRSRWTNQLDEWMVEDNQHGTFYMYTFQEMDPRDWAIDDRLSERISPAMRLAMIFIVIFHSTPKQ
jgi:hypothetical protein